MDPVTAIGFIASLDQLASVSANIVSNMYRYYRAVMDAPKRSEELRQEIGAVSDILNMIVMVVSSSSAASTFTVPTSFHASVTEMQATLAEMDKLVRPSATRGVKRLKWPFTKDENERLLSKLGRYKDILSATMEIKTA